MDATLTPLLKLLIAAALGGAIGYERETHGQFAGFRTNLLVCVGACLMMLLSLHIEELYHSVTSETALRVDPGRIASYAIASMGFLGGGAIIKGKGTVRGLTTAASLWMVTGMGLAVGAGYLAPALATTVISLVALYHSRTLKKFMPHRQYVTLGVTLPDDLDSLPRLKAVFAPFPSLHVLFVNRSHDVAAGRAVYRLRLQTHGEPPWPEVMAGLRALPGLEKITLTESSVP